jgi:hypothetical protein
MNHRINYGRTASCSFVFALSCALSACERPAISKPDLVDAEWRVKHSFRSVQQDHWTLEAWLNGELFWTGTSVGIAIRLSAPDPANVDSPDVCLRLTDAATGGVVRERHPIVQFRRDANEQFLVSNARISDAFPGEPTLPVGSYLLEIELVTSDGTHLSLQDMPFKVQRYRTP